MVKIVDKTKEKTAIFFDLKPGEIGKIAGQNYGWDNRFVMRIKTMKYASGDVYGIFLDTGDFIFLPYFEVYAYPKDVVLTIG